MAAVLEYIRHTQRTTATIPFTPADDERRRTAVFDDDEPCVSLPESPAFDVRAGCYHLISKTAHNETGELLYRLSHPLAEHVIGQGREATTPPAQVAFDVTRPPTKPAVIEKLKGAGGQLALDRLTVESLELEEYLLFPAVTDGGEVLDQDCCERLFRCEGRVGEAPAVPAAVADRLAQRTQSERLFTIRWRVA